MQSAFLLGRGGRMLLSHSGGRTHRVSGGGGSRGGPKAAGAWGGNGMAVG